MYGGNNSQISPLMQQEREHWQAGTMNNIFPLWQQQIGRLGEADQMSEMFRQKFLQSLDPGYMSSLATSFRNRANAGVDEAGQQMASSLRSQGIYGQDAAANLAAQNQAAMRANDYEASLYSPENLGKNALSGMQAVSPDMIVSLLPLMQAMSGGDMDLRQLMAQESANRGRNGLGGVIGTLLGSMSGGIPWSKIFGK